MASINRELIHELEEFCSPSNKNLLLEGLHGKLKQIASTSSSSLACSHFLHELCRHPNVTLEMVELVLELSPYAAYFCTNRYHGRDVDPKDIIDYADMETNENRRPQHHLMSDRAYPIHIACASNCPPAIICLLAKSNPAAVGHYCLLKGGCRTNREDAPVIGLPIHYYFARSQKLDLDAVKCLYEAYPDCLGGSGVTNQENYHPIHALMENPTCTMNTEVLRYLVSLNPELLKVKDSDSKLPLHLALKNQHMSPEVAMILIDTWQDSVFHRDTMYHFPLHKLLLNQRKQNDNFIEILKLLVKIYPELLRTPSPLDGKYPIHLAASYQSPDYIKILVDEFPDSLKRRDRESKLGFHCACQYGTAEAVKYLYELAPESIHAVDCQKHGPIHLATTRTNDPTLEVLKFLVRHDPEGVSKPDPHVDAFRKYYNFLPLHYAAKNGGSLEAIQYLFNHYPDAIFIKAMEANPSVSQISDDSSITLGLTPTQLAEQSGHTDAYLFLQNQITALARYRAIPHPLVCAILDSQPLGIVKLMAQEYPEDYKESCDRNNNSPLHYVCMKGRADIVTFFLKKWPMHGMDQNDEGKFPLELFLESPRCTDDAEFVEALWHLLVASPQVISF